MKTFKDYLRRHRINEASFKTEDLLKVCKLYGSLFSKGLGAPLRVWGMEDFQRSGEEGSGVRMVNVNGDMFRFNFSNTINGYANSKAVVLSSIDYWEPGNKDLEYPTTTCTFSKEVNVIQIWKKLSDIILSGKYGEYTRADLGAMNEADDLFKMGDSSTRRDFLSSKGISGWKAGNRGSFEKELEDQGLEDEWKEYVAKVGAGKPEKNTTEGRMQKAEKMLKQVKYADPDVVFNDLVTLTKVFHKGKRKLLTVCGMGGLGKCIDVDTLIATPNGYVRAGDIKVGDKVFTPKNTVANVVDVYPQDELKECYEVVLSDGRSVVADEEQLFNVKINEDFENISLRDIIETFKVKEVIFPVCNKEFVRSELPLKEVKPVGLRETICFRIDDPDHLFLTSDYMIVHNTFEIKHTLETLFGSSPNKHWIYIPAGKFTTLQFFQEVYDARDRIICFDEADNIVTNDEIVTMLKPALDTSGDGQMTYNTGTKRMTDMSKKEVEQYCGEVDYWHGQEGVPFAFGKRFGKKENIFGTDTFDEDSEITGVWMPSRFYFTGKMIFISNLPLAKIDNALLTRGSRVDVTLTLQGKIRRVQTVLKHMHYPADQIEMIINYLEQQDDPEYVSVRTAVAFIDFLGQDADVGGVEEAARLAAMYG